MTTLANRLQRRFGLVSWAGVTESPRRSREDCRQCGRPLRGLCIGTPDALLCLGCAEARSTFDPLIAAAVARAESRKSLAREAAGE